MRQTTAELEDIENYILSSIKHTRFGSVVITIHDSRIVQVEKSEKRRFDNK